MREESSLETNRNRGFYRTCGCFTAGALADMIDEALSQARAAGVSDIVIDITGAIGFESPGPAYRRWVARRWAATVEGTLRVAVIARREHICPAKTGLLVAAEEGLSANISDSEANALGWLDDYSKRLHE